MAGLNEDAQWIVLMGFVVSFSLFFLAIVINQSTVVGQATAEAVSEFPKEDIRGVREVIIQSVYLDEPDRTLVQNEIRALSLARQNSVVDLSSVEIGQHQSVDIHYNNGVTAYSETYSSP
ncbi:MAG: hypothetical protein LUP97_04455 [Methanoregula sp.]|nr:hypothetical protein [Methanoregula sp.]